ncbi:MAG: hypothetical protein M3Z23_02165 [Acidobacteriota bacterium]|nr:hypothetical protein [Acidobacteriota bacterium]
MSLSLLKDIRAAYSNLNPDGVRTQAEREVNVALIAESDFGYATMERYLAPLSLSPEKRGRSLAAIHRVNGTSGAEKFDFVLCDEGIDCPENGLRFQRGNPEQTVCNVLDAHQDIELALARTLYPFRDPVVSRIIQRVSRENAMFTLMTALPNVIPSFIELPWAVGEFATDTAFLTINQIRMAFLISAASDNGIGYTDQKGEIATIIASAFGWRAIARELIGKIPLGGGLIPKGVVSFAGTYAVGRSLDKFHQTGYGMSRAEHRQAYANALEKGRGVVEMLLSTLKAGLRKPSAA